MSKNDEKIIKKFPEATPYDLLTVHGLSQAGYNELITVNDSKEVEKLTQKPGNLLVPDRVVESGKHRVTPQISTIQNTRGVDHMTVWVVNNATGKRFKLSEFAAKRWVKKHGMKFAIEA